MTKQLKANPLEVFGVRKCSFAPPYFEYVDFPTKYNLEESLSKWISTNCKKRYFVGKNIKLDSNNAITNVITVGFEDSKEMSYFMLACPHLKYS